VNRFGKIILISSTKQSLDEVLSLYRERDEVEKKFDDLKNELEVMPLSTKHGYNAGIVIQFLLIIDPMSDVTFRWPETLSCLRRVLLRRSLWSWQKIWGEPLQVDNDLSNINS